MKSNCNVYLLDIEMCSDYVKGCGMKLSEVRMDKFSRAMTEKHKDVMLCTEFLLCTALHHEGLTDEFLLHYSYDEYGKPCFLGIGDADVSLSHSGNYVCCAVSAEKIGIDIECKCTREFSMRLSRRICAEGEEAPNNSDLLIEKWVKKEAYMKLCGKGFFLPMSSFSEHGDTYFDTSKNPVGRSYFTSAEEYMLAIAMEIPPIPSFFDVTKHGDVFSRN